MSNNKQSSIIWFAVESWKLGMQLQNKEISIDKHSVLWVDLLVKAKEMHKEEIIEVWIDAYTTNMKRPTRDNFILWAENYYEQTYGGNK